MPSSSGPRSLKGKQREAEELDKPTTAANLLSPLMDQLLAGGFISKPLDASNWDPQEASKLERCLSTMMGRLSASQQDLSRLMDRHRGLASDFDRLEQAQLKNKQTLEASEHEKEQAKAKSIAAAKELTVEQARHTLAKEEIQKARLALSSVKSMSQHESKRRENEVASIMARWQKMSSTSSSLQHPASIVVNDPEKIGKTETFPRSHGSGTGRETPSGVALLEESLTRLDEEKHAMQEENIHLREVLGDVLNEVRATLSSIDADILELEDGFDDPLVHVTSPHLSLSPNEMMDYLSKLLLSLRDATLSAIHNAEEAVSAAQAEAQEDTTKKIIELEMSLSAMQADLDAARLEAIEAKKHYELAQLGERSSESKALERAKLDRREAKKAKADLEEFKISYEKLKLQHERERTDLLETVSKLQGLEVEVGTLKRRAAQDDSNTDAPMSKRRKAVPSPRKDLSYASSRVSDNHQPMQQESRRTMRQSTTSAALRNILASAADTPPNRPAPLSSKASNSLGVSRQSAAGTKDCGSGEDATEKDVPLGSAALAAKDRIHRAVEAAKARTGPDSRVSNITQRRK